MFNPKIKTNTGIVLFFQQLKALLTKRARIFIHRYLLASLILVAPVVLECLFCLIIPSQTYLLGDDDTAAGVVRFSDDYQLGLDSYGRFRMPIYTNGSTYIRVPLQHLISTYYNDESTTTIVELNSPNISGYVIEERLRDLRLLVDDYYVGMDLNLTGVDRLFGTLYYSSLAFHSSSNVLHEWSNLFLSLLTNKPGVSDLFNK